VCFNFDSNLPAAPIEILPEPVALLNIYARNSYVNYLRFVVAVDFLGDVFGACLRPSLCG